MNKLSPLVLLTLFASTQAFAPVIAPRTVARSTTRHVLFSEKDISDLISKANGYNEGEGSVDDVEAMIAELKIQQREMFSRLEDVKNMVAHLQNINEADEDFLNVNSKGFADGNVKSGGEIRIFMDGAFDMTHYGHMNAFRLARSLGTHLVVGVNSDKSITECKGAPLMNDDERMTMVKGCKFVDEVVPDCPYVMSEEYLEYVIKKYKIDYVIHGDDPCIVNGKDVYESAKKAGKFQSIPRTEGVSTTDIVGRMLLMNKDHHYNSIQESEAAEKHDRNSLLCEQSQFLTTSRMLRLFSAGMKSSKPGQKILYVDGAFDMFHCGHVTFLQQAKKRGDYLIVGIHSDQFVNKQRGCNLPLMNLHERVLSVLGCGAVDDVLIGAPPTISKEMITLLKIDEVICGTTSDHFNEGPNSLEDRYRVPKKLGIFKELKSNSCFTLAGIVQRIQANQSMFQAKIAKKKKAEADFYNEKYKKQEVATE